MISPLVSIITVTFNAEKHLEQTINSVVNQTYKNIEYIIIDGGSTDSTLDIIKKYNKQVDIVITEQDKGIYDAMNKGIKIARGSIIGIINADDWYEIDAVEHIIEIFEREVNTEIIHGNLEFINIEKKTQKVKRSRLTKINLLLGLPIYHPTTFVRSYIYKNNPFDINYRIAADWKLFFKLFLKKYSFKYTDHLIAHFRTGGASSNFKLASKEIRQGLVELNIPLFIIRIFTILRILKNFKKFILKA